MITRRSISFMLLAVLGVSVGLAVGIGSYTFGYAGGASYLTDDPRACANCHVMRQEYEAWSKSSHHAVAVCNDCHAPADFLGKYATKASNGFWHSFYFTTGGFPDPIRLRERNRAITKSACRGCHEDFVAALATDVDCLHCHRGIGHDD